MCATRALFIVRCPIENEVQLPISESHTPCDFAIEQKSSANVTQDQQPLIQKVQFVQGKQISVKISEILKRLHVRWSTWLKSSCDDFSEVHFCCDEGIESEKMIEELSTIGIGQLNGTCILVLPVSYATKDARAALKSKSTVKFNHPTNHVMGDSVASNSFDNKLTRREFIKSIRSRLTVPQVFHTISASTRITFDYVSLAILASLISAFGLRNNSSVVIVASMLISPLMGPILAMVFAITIMDTKLLMLGVKAEMLGIGLSLIVGLFVGILDAIVRVQRNNFMDYPTHEMCDRGQLYSLLNGILVALPSGAGVAISVLGGNIGSLVGVAISASLLPPAVNCGMLMGLAFISSVCLPRRFNTTKNESLCPAHGNIISEMDNLWIANRAVGVGFISLLLAVLNIFCILLTGIIVLKIKQVNRKNTFADKFWDDLKTSKNGNDFNDKGHSQIRMDYIQHWAEQYGLDVDNDRNIQNSDVRRRVKLFAHDLSQINSDLNMITTNVYRYGPTTHYDSILEEMLPGLPPKWTDIFEKEHQTNSSRFEVVPALSDEEV